MPAGGVLLEVKEDESMELVFKFTKFEYYVDYMTNIFSLTNIAMSYFVAFGHLLVMLFIGKIYFQLTENKK